jgi:putative membrane protein (TIGR04086 family)
LNTLKGSFVGTKTSSPVLRGLLYAFVTMSMSTILASLVYRFSGVSEQSMSSTVYMIHSLSLFIGGWVAGRRSQFKGWYYGSITGFVYCIVIIIMGFLSYNATVTSYTFIQLGLSVVVGAIGGMAGVNLRKS